MADYPKNLKIFRAWAKAMEEGATVDRPNYSKGSKTLSGRKRPKKRRRRRRLTQARRLRKQGD